MKRAYVIILTVFGLFFTTTDVHAQLGANKQLLGLFRDVIAKPNLSTVRIKADNKDAALGTIVSADGWILSKYSEIKGKKLVCRLPDGKEVEPEMFGFDELFDVVMLKVDASELTPIELTESKISKVGHWVASVGDGPEPVALGVISVASREIAGARFWNPSGAPGGYMGMALDLDFKGVKAQEILPNTPAAKAGIKVGDVVLAVNGEKVKNTDEFLGYLSRKKSGDEVTLTISRSDMEIEVKATLGTRPGTQGNKSRGEQQNAMGSKLNERKIGFPVILQHDSVLKPHDCGGPLVNLEGKVIGINIARAGRTESYAIPSEVVRPMMERLKTRNPESSEDKNLPKH